MTKTQKILYYNINDVSTERSNLTASNGTRGTSFRNMLDRENNRIEDTIYFDTNIIRGIEKVNVKESFAIESGEENRLLCEASYSQKLEQGITTTLNSLEYAVKSATGKFCNTKRVIIFFNNIMGSRRIVLIE